MKIYKVLDYANDEMLVVRVSELRQLLEDKIAYYDTLMDKRRLDKTELAIYGFRVRVYKELLAELEGSSPRASPAGEGLKEKVTK